MIYLFFLRANQFLNISSSTKVTGLEGGKYLKQSTIYNGGGEVNLKKPFKETPDIYSAKYLFISGLLVNKEQKLGAPG